MSSSTFNALEAMDAPLRTWMAHHTRAELVQEGTALIREGQPPGRLIWIESGSARVETFSQDGRQIELAILGPGALVGDMSFLEQRPPVASVLAGPDCSVMATATTELQAAMGRDASLASAVYSLFARKLTHQLASQNSFVHRWRDTSAEPLRKALVVFAHLEEVDVEWLGRLGRRRHVESGSEVIVQGDPVPDLLVVLAGSAGVEISGQNGPVEVGSSRAGELLGEMSLLGGDDRATATVRARGPMELLAIPKDSLRERFTSDPALAARFYRAMAILLSQRSREQLHGKGLAAATRRAEEQAWPQIPVSTGKPPPEDMALVAEEQLNMDQMSSLSIAGQRFHWLCQSVGLPHRR